MSKLLPVSLCLAYFERPRSLRLGLNSITENYSGSDGFEVIVIDDGSIRFPARPILDEYRAKGLRIRDQYNGPPKAEALTPVTPLNLAVAMAENEIIVISNPEKGHEGPILFAMLEELRNGNKRTVVCAACRGHDLSWHEHSAHQRNGRHFCLMMHRSMFGMAGGFDLDYRYAGSLFDDDDFVQRLLAAGAEYAFRDDCVVFHHRPQDEQCQWAYPPKGNFDLFNSKWPNPKKP